VQGSKVIGRLTKKEKAAVKSPRGERKSSERRNGQKRLEVDYRGIRGRGKKSLNSQKSFN